MKKILSKVFVVLFLFLVAGCSSSNKSSNTGSSGDSDKAQSGGELKIGLSSNIATLDPISYTAVYESNVMRSIYDTLVTYNSDLTEIGPSLAKSWEVSEDMTEYTFTLRDDVYFQKGEYQDGRKMTAEDVKYSLERSLNDSAMNRLRYVKEIDVTSETVLTIKLDQPYAAFLAMLTDMGNAIVAKEEVVGWGEDYGSHPVGTGPFAFSEWAADDHVTLKRNNKYWGDKPYLDSVKFSFITDTNTMGNSLQSGDIDVATNISGQNVKIIEKNSDLVLSKTAGLSMGYLAFNMKSGPTADLKVRQAMNLALDRKELLAGVYKYDEAKVAYLPLPRASWGYSKTVETEVKDAAGPDLDEAKKLLTEAGYADGFDIDLYVTEARVTAATIFQSQMAKIGINITIKTVEWGTFSDTVAAGEAPLYIMGWSWYPDPDFFLYQMFSTNQIGALGNGGGYSNAEVDQLLQEATATTVDETERAAIYEKALKLISADLPHLDLYDQDIIAGLNNKVHDYIVRADNTIVLVDEESNVWLSQD